MATVALVRPIGHPAEKACLTCHEPKRASKFDLTPSGNLRGDCRDCRNRRSRGLIPNRPKPEPPEREQRCRVCGETKTLDRFYVTPAGNPRRECADCLAERTRRYYFENRDEAMERKYFHRAKYLYGVTREQVFAMNDEQGGCCKICRVPFRVGRRPDLDHCHATGQVRGLLCTDCNTGLGHFRDDPRHLLAAAIYLVESRGPSALAEAGST